MGDENHAANLVELPGGDILCVWFAGSGEGSGDIRIALSRLPAGGTQWTQPVWVSQGVHRSEQNPSLFVAPNGELHLYYTSQETRGVPRRAWQEQVSQGTASGPYTMQWTAVICRRVSADGGATWGPVEIFSDRPGSFCRHAPTPLSNGSWIFPMYYSVLEEGDRAETAHGERLYGHAALAGPGQDLAGNPRSGQPRAGTRQRGRNGSRPAAGLFAQPGGRLDLSILLKRLGTYVVHSNPHLTTQQQRFAAGQAVGQRPDCRGLQPGAKRQPRP